MSIIYQRVNTSQSVNENVSDSPFPAGVLTIDPSGNLAIHDGTTIGGLQVYPFLGNVTLPQGSTISEVTATVPGGSATAMQLIPAGGSNPNQRLLIYPTVVEGNHVHLTTGDQTVTDLYLGNDYQYIKVSSSGNVTIGTNNDSQHWNFDTAGVLTLSSDSVIQGSNSDANVYVQTVSGITTNNWTFGLDAVLSLPDYGAVPTGSANNPGFAQHAGTLYWYNGTAWKTVQVS